jgi:hypothetical protein
VLVVLLLPGGLMEAWHRARRLVRRGAAGVGYRPAQSPPADR